ncbi:MAG: AMP-dependent synthetase/ligase, partial [Waddliaceae bacterium]
PSLMIVVPRVLEKMFDSMEFKIFNERNRLKRWLGTWAFSLAKNPSQSILKNYLLRPIADFLVYSKIRKTLGGRWRVILCGGAALDPELCQFYINIGIPVFEGWGLTEGSTTCTNIPGKTKVGTVGRPLPGIKIEIAENDEVLLGGPTVMKGYYRNPAATEEAIDGEGWLHTGDKGVIDEEGFLKIVGRVKEQFKLSTGEYLSPDHIEHMLCQHPLVDMSMVIGEKRKHASCLLFPDMVSLKREKKKQKVEDLSNEDFLQSPYVRQEMEQLLEKINSKVNSWEKLFKYRFILEVPTIERGELTPTLKLKRRVILEKFKDVIDAIYTEEKA